MSESLPPDPYEVLGVPVYAEISTIKSAYRKLVLKCHPDRVQDAALKAIKQDEFEKVQKAYELLSDDKRRENYDWRKDMLENRSSPPILPTKRAELYETRSGSSGLRDSSRQDKRPRDTRVRMEAEKWREKERAIDEVRREKKDRGKYRSAYIEDDDSDDDSDDNSDSYVPLSAKEKGIESEIKHRNEWMQSVFALKSADAPPVVLQDPKEPVEVSKDVEAEKESAKVLFTSVPPAQLGIKVMNPETTNPSIDIIAVHGLGAIPEFTWKAKGTGVNWLSESTMLPQAVPEARIMRFGYDSLWLGKTPVRTRLGIIADKLLLHLGKERHDIPNPNRPLIFIGHCFGGLVIQRALITAKLEESTYCNIFQSSVGVVFLGTPHRGSKSFLAEGKLRTRIEMRNIPQGGESSLPQGKLLAQILSKSDLRQGIEPGVLDEMRSDSGTLLTDSEFFSRLCRSNELLVTSFFEQRGSDLLKTIGDSGPEEFIVPEESATFDSHTNIGLPLDHFSLNKFSDPQDGNYREVCWEITKMYQAAKTKLLSGPLDSSGVKNDASLRLLRKIAPPGSLKRFYNDLQEEENLRQLAMQELDQEEADKLAAAKEEEFEKKYQERLAAEREQESEQAENETEKMYKDRWLANMKKYRVQDAQKIIDSNPPPKTSDLTPQESKERLRWYKNRIKASLRERGVPGGIVDEILNDIVGDTMVIGGERTTFTKMALKWVDLRTLNRYDVPYILDKDDSSAVIIARWVPEYEQEFFWDHSFKLRQKAKERKQRPSKKKSELSTKNTEPAYSPYISPYEPEPSPRRGRKNSGTRSRHASMDSIHSAPDSEAVARRRQHSRTLSEERPAFVKRQSYDGGRADVRYVRYASDVETGRRTTGIMLGIKKVFGG